LQLNRKDTVYTGHSLFIILKTSKATVVNLLIFREGIFVLSSGGLGISYVLK